MHGNATLSVMLKLIVFRPKHLRSDVGYGISRLAKYLQPVHPESSTVQERAPGLHHSL